MDILLVQAETEWKSPEANLERLEKMIYGAPAADLVVLPEMFTTGFVTSPGGVAEKEGAQTLQWMSEVAVRRNAAVAGSVSVESKGEFYNRLYFVRPDGTHEVYDKRHLFSFAGENKAYTPGRERVIVQWRGWRILLLVCYDLRFPVFARNRGDYDMILCVGNWPEERRGVWDVLLRARAVENLCYVAAANRVGADPDCVYDGGTALIDFEGSVVASASDNGSAAIVGRADMKALGEFRKRFPALWDADDFELKL